MFFKALLGTKEIVLVGCASKSNTFFLKTLITGECAICFRDSDTIAKLAFRHVGLIIFFKKKKKRKRFFWRAFFGD
jgi:hypothetical protein